eukprot:Unigene6100_Nuclearia_a/m.18692 Unigene6100_Nuclearia_a/g.18692  ORF Unigene6100_Nuclearia_a/g.18692 Unigene6100_Nuclearia_a/m.18692 type:complete len:244 (+) Unigene6100_Nuclearia_a:814-1545(+)
MTLVKICGVRGEDAAVTAADAGCDLIGLIFAVSKRQVALATAQGIAARVRSPNERGTAQLDDTSYTAAARSLTAERMRLGRPLLVGIFADQPAEHINEIAEAVPLDLVQLHGLHEPVDMPAKIVRPCLRALHVLPDDTAATVRERLRAHEGHAALSLLDTGVKGSAVQGGSGKEFDWSIAAELAREGFPFLLAGGLTPTTVASAVVQVRPLGVDVSSGVEDAATGQKDLGKICAFVAAAAVSR